MDMDFTLDNKNLLVTGGTGSFGKRFIATVLEQHSPSRIVIFSRDELKQYEMQNMPVFKEHASKLRFFIGDVRDQGRLMQAMEGVDVVVHAAALKQVPACEYNPFEAVKTNILGAENVINACLSAGVSRVIALSTDKAAAPINLYGATKLASDKLFTAANNFRGSRDIRFSVVRYGNVMGSRGSVIPFFAGLASSGRLPITDMRMTRFNITLQDGAQFVLDCFERMWGGEIFVPKIPSYRITDIAAAIAPDAELEEVGIRPGEKVHEEMITKTDSLSSIKFDDYYVIVPSLPQWDVEEFRLQSSKTPGVRCEPDFAYESGTNPDFLTVENLQELIESDLG
jgi:UDP-N-acetylglucosamine 4,6-dehydratase/5-epimerase